MPELSTEQGAALEQIFSWLDDPFDDPFFILKGYAGTGKTFTITQMTTQGPIKPSSICFTAPTNKAVKVLRGYLSEHGISSPTKTIYSLLGLRLEANGEVKEISNPDKPVDLSDFSLIIVDEASMINSFLMSEIRRAAAQWSIPFLFMGDPAQLPPVGEDTSPVWSITNSAELTTVMRYGNSILDLATSIRKVVDHPFPSITVATAPPVHRLRKPEWLTKAYSDIDLFLSGEAKMIAWRNITVGKYNSLLRRHIFGPSADTSFWLPTDKIVAVSPLNDLDGNTFMTTDEEATILDVAEATHPLFSEYRVHRLLVELESKVRYSLNVLHPSSASEVQSTLAELSQKAKSGQRQLWRNYWAIREAFHEVRHSYAITSHRSQGSSYRKSWVDLEDILLNRNRREAFRSLYVACTRAREELNIA